MEQPQTDIGTHGIDKNSERQMVDFRCSKGKESAEVGCLPGTDDKENIPENSHPQRSSKIPPETNQSFNAFFNNSSRDKEVDDLLGSENTTKGKHLQPIQEKGNSNNSFLPLNQRHSRNSQINTQDSSSRLSNFMFVSDHSEMKTSKSHSKGALPLSKRNGRKAVNWNGVMHAQTRQFMEKYFPDNYSTNNYQNQFVSLTDFVEILFEEHHNLMQNSSADLLETFAEKVFEIFGDSIYFQALIDHTREKGLIGLIFQVFKMIEEQQLLRQQLTPSSEAQKQIENMTDSSERHLNSFQNRTETTKISFNENSENSIYTSGRQNTQSSIRFEKMLNPLNRNNPQTSFQSYVKANHEIEEAQQTQIEDIKNILEQYMESMYEHSERNLMKRFNTETRKVSVKHKQVEKLLQKVNQKVSSYYDCLSLEKEYEKKINVMKLQMAQNQKDIKDLTHERKELQSQLKSKSEENSSQKQQIKRLNAKLEKYENAILQKALQANRQSNVVNNRPHQDQKSTPTQDENSLKGSDLKIVSKPTSCYPQFDSKISKVTENQAKPNSVQVRDYSPSPYAFNPSPYTTKNPTTPKNADKLNAQSGNKDRASISPIRSRVVFHKPVSEVPQPSKPCNLSISHVERVEVGSGQLRPLSPIHRIDDSTRKAESSFQQQSGSSQVGLQKRSHSPFTSSRIITISPIRRRI